MNRIRRLFAILLTIAPAQAFGQPTPMPDSVRRYLNEALDTLERVSMHRDSVDWSALHDSVFARAATAKTTDDTWRTLLWALRFVDHHSFMQTPRPFPASPSTTSVPGPKQAGPPPVSGRLIDGRLGYLLVPWFAGMNRPSFVDSLQTLIGAFNDSGACGWIIDLRKNSGGNMWPMLAGVGPLLGDSVMGSFYTTTEQGTQWHYRQGRTWSGPKDDPPWGSGSLPPVTVRDPLAPVALLTGRVTASSGEATLLAFLGRPNVRTFGDTTAGFNSVNNGYKLSDGANMVITVGLSRDRLGRSYPLSIAPDEFIPISTGDEHDAVLDRARGWLASQSSCQRQ